ncbi:hypothetical protein PRABACTJOHN_01250 [Parabacteroides johnsonii DSM 18315]|uniref:Uncharacterized protein n=1 Tax=Parabacteroides johnsonii DSM 18315 TaxID=537006 RepID=B7B899_9BACT|nr:hypothetical protein PRABACTJOHN_01250 [Parabacteroides johnsonii DSM 18315]
MIFRFNDYASKIEIFPRHYPPITKNISNKPINSTFLQKQEITLYFIYVFL